MIVDKYVDHLPIHRQLQRYGRMGVSIAQSTSNDWFRMTLNHLCSLYEVHKKVTLTTGYLNADETPIKVLDEDKKERRTGVITGYITTANKDWCCLTTGPAGRAGRMIYSKTSRGICKRMATALTRTLTAGQGLPCCIVWRMPEENFLMPCKMIKTGRSMHWHYSSNCMLLSAA